MLHPMYAREISDAVQMLTFSSADVNVCKTSLITTNPNE